MQFNEMGIWLFRTKDELLTMKVLKDNITQEFFSETEERFEN